MTNVTIKRSKWLKGEAEDNYLLRPSDNKMCCLGFVALAFGYTTTEIETQGTPADLSSDIPMPGLLGEGGKDTPLCNAIIKVNDNIVLPNDDRESILKELFKAIDIHIVFED